MKLETGNNDDPVECMIINLHAGSENMGWALHYVQCVLPPAVHFLPGRLRDDITILLI